MQIGCARLTRRIEWIKAAGRATFLLPKSFFLSENWNPLIQINDASDRPGSREALVYIG
jgi:hypothetical protein